MKTTEYRHEYVEDIPEQHEDGVIYLFGKAENLWSAALKCPCGCGDVIQLGLLKGMHPGWTLTITDDKPTLTPSINRGVGCKSHFCITNGQVT